MARAKRVRCVRRRLRANAERAFRKDRAHDSSQLDHHILAGTLSKCAIRSRFATLAARVALADTGRHVPLVSPARRAQSPAAYPPSCATPRRLFRCASALAVRWSTPGSDWIAARGVDGLRWPHLCASFERVRACTFAGSAIGQRRELPCFLAALTRRDACQR